MDKKKLLIPSIFIMTIIILVLIFNMFSLQTKLKQKQRLLDVSCISMLSDVQFVWNYEIMDDADIRSRQAVAINNLKNAQPLIHSTSWPEKDKINEMVLSLISYYTIIYVKGERIEDSEAAGKLYHDYYGTIINIDNEYCKPAIKGVMEFLKKEP
jgi:hypothetical protein